MTCHNKECVKYCAILLKTCAILDKYYPISTYNYLLVSIKLILLGINLERLFLTDLVTKVILETSTGLILKAFSRLVK